MADKYYSDFHYLVAAAQKAVPNILRTDVAPVAKEILKEHIQKDIYDAYTPKPGGWVGGSTYQRRHVLESKTIAYLEDYETLLVTSDATASPSILKGWSFHNRDSGAFLQMLEEGDMGFWRKGFPRPAVSNAQSEIDSSKKITNAIKQGITREIGTCM